MLYRAIFERAYFIRNILHLLETFDRVYIRARTRDRRAGRVRVFSFVRWIGVRIAELGARDHPPIRRKLNFN